MVDGEVFDVPALLESCNPWWRGAERHSAGLTAPATQRLQALLLAHEAALLVVDGQRQTGKSTLLLALVRALLRGGVTADRVCLVTLAESPLRWSTATQLVEAWRSRLRGSAGPACLLVDDLQLWSASAQDALLEPLQGFPCSVVVAGTAAAAVAARWRASGRTLALQHIGTGNFAHYLALQTDPPAVPDAPRSLRDLFDWSGETFVALAEPLRRVCAHFDDYLARGGYSRAQRAGSVESAHAYLREELVPRAVRWDATALHGVRREADLEHTLHYLAARAGTLLDVPELCARLTVERPTARHFLDLLEGLGLLQRVPPLGYGDSVQRARFLICLSDPALAPALLWQSTQVGVNEVARAVAVESAVLRHLKASYGARGARISYAALARGGRTLVVGSGQQVLPFALHHARTKASGRALTGLAALCKRHGVERAYLATRLPEDFGPLRWQDDDLAIMRVPAALLCLWLAAAEVPGLDTG